MRGIEETRQRWDTLFCDNDTTAGFRNALRLEQDDKLCNDGLRSICWKAFLLFDDLDRAQWPQKLSDSRTAYVALKAHFLKYIDHPDDLESTVDPLADDVESPWQTLRNDEQTRADISQDVDRCLQENFFFREPTTKAKMIDILFIYAKLNPDLGYRQGMHEILAPLLWVVDRDAIETNPLEDTRETKPGDNAMLQLLDANYVEHDSFALFCSVMQNVRVYYEHNRTRSANGQLDVIPIVHQCQRLHNELLVTADLELADHLQALEILPQIFLTRWMRLLFGREFAFQDVLQIWDLLFAEGLRPELIEYVCVAMLLRIRWQLLSADSSSALSILLRYPAPDPHSPLTFVYDGIYLEQNPTPERGLFIISKYSGRPPDLSRGLGQPSAKPSKGKFRLRSASRDLSEVSSPSRSPARNSPKSLEALFQDVSEGIQRRTEAWGVAKAVRGAVSEAKRNMQSIQSEHQHRGTRYENQSQGLGTPWDRASDDTSKLKAKIEELEGRNRELAKLLSVALKDIRSHVNKAENMDSSDKDALAQALNKVQSIQSCLEDHNIPLSAADQSPSEHSNAESETPPEAAEAPSDSAKIANDGADRASTFTHRTSTSAESPRSPIGVGTKVNRSTATSPQFPTSMPLRHVSRPSLADSEFSWMLGGKRHLSSFVSPASVLPEQTRHGEGRPRSKPASLFGNGDEEHGKPGAEIESDGLALRSLRGPKP
ncbi:GTPase-activating protein GYP6 [Aspergillus brunneoviolaceus CBS 621.78]|uniref:RabGAP/TBC n=1 Tax=Aspergillus brunneoviolaceus CBS 621.78 TaxID=1450534 RepID=A0ACD1FWT7_9EURO|nr:RabGAP/TBC [Aspergillus brunneoviolaceus CBS 621.78]RAH41451.1 RabGAP/TBC [Aspergillus brunneoviolaceus CBS 621.78]